MKFLKLVIAFVLIVGGIVLAVNWNNLFTSTAKINEFPAEDKIDISEQCDKIRMEWERCIGFDMNVYKTLRSDIDQSKKMGLFSREGYEIVNNCLRETSVNKACDAYHSEIGNSTSFSHKKVAQCYNLVKELMELEQLDNTLNRINEVSELHKYYSNVKKFTDSNHRIRAKFDTNKTEWVSFASEKQSVMNKGNKLSMNPLYDKVKHIPGFETGLSQTHLIKATNRWRESFYTDLCSQIIDYFKALEPTVDRVNQLKQIYKNFLSQEEDCGVAELADFVVSYRVPEEENENANI